LANDRNIDHYSASTNRRHPNPHSHPDVAGVRKGVPVDLATPMADRMPRGIGGVLVRADSCPTGLSNLRFADPAPDRSPPLTMPVSRWAQGLVSQIVLVFGALLGPAARRRSIKTQRLLKQAEDFIVGIIALIIVGPIMLAAAIAVRLEDTGPILFRQQRVGLNGTLFTIYKFRTMTVDPMDDGSNGTGRNNPRITRIGRILRGTSVDELPQLINVLRGEMSIVGPRPHVPNMRIGESIYSEVVQQYSSRHRAKPGITGWAQINGMRGGIDTLEKAHRSADLDLWYVANWSLTFDLQIMIRTILFGLVDRSSFSS
jgi:lipopolysaccharide/colanic/teichoic acid biosynthesis glycosyltransferase